jgi:hypothetical protein
MKWLALRQKSEQIELVLDTVTKNNLLVGLFQGIACMKAITNNDILVVAPDPYRYLARKLSHEIAKKTGLNAAYWTIKQYEDNEFQVGAARYVILLGNPDENPLTKDYLPTIGKNLINRYGACYGYDGSKAVVFGEGNLDQNESFQKLRKGITDNPPEKNSQSAASSSPELGYKTKLYLYTMMTIAWSIEFTVKVICQLPIAILFHIFGGRGTYKRISRESREADEADELSERQEDLRNEQTGLAIAFFLTETFDHMVKATDAN